MLVIITKGDKEESHVTKGSEKTTLCGLLLEEGEWEMGLKGKWLTCRTCKAKYGEKFRGKATGVLRLTILNAIMGCFSQVFISRRLDRPDCQTKANDFVGRAEELIRLLETNDCNSIGGHDGPNSGIPSLFMRFEWLLYKYNLPINLKVADTYEDVRTFFTTKE